MSLSLGDRARSSERSRAEVEGYGQTFFSSQLPGFVACEVRESLKLVGFMFGHPFPCGPPLSIAEFRESLKIVVFILVSFYQNKGEASKWWGSSFWFPLKIQATGQQSDQPGKVRTWPTSLRRFTSSHSMHSQRPYVHVGLSFLELVPPFVVGNK